MADDNDRIRKRRVGRDASPSQLLVNTASSSRKLNGSNHSDQSRNGRGNSYTHVGRKKRVNRRASNLISRWIMNLRKTRSPAAIGLAVVVTGIVLAVCLIAAITSLFSSYSNDCIESHINGIPGNIYHWCYKHKNDSHSDESIHGKMSRALSKKARTVKRIVFDESLPLKHPKKMMISAINSHERVSEDIVTENYSDICYADLARFGDHMNDQSAYHQTAIGPCHYDTPLTEKPLSGSYEEVIDYYFFRESVSSKYTDRLKCLNECIDHALTSADKGKHHGHIHAKEGNDEDHLHKYRQYQEADERGLDEIKPEEKVPVDNVMLIEAARAGMTLATEKLLLKFGLDPLYRQVHDDPSSGRSLNAIQTAIRGGYAEIVGILTAGDNSMVIDEYGRTVEDYVTMSGSPIRPVDAKNVLGIHVEEGLQKKPEEKTPPHHKKSGWSEVSADQYDKERCDFDIVDGDIDPEVFYKDYFMTGRPVVLRGQVPPMEFDMFSKKRWYQNKEFHPDKTFEVGPTAYPAITDQESCSKEMSINEIEQGMVCAEMPEKPMVHAFHPESEDFEELYPEFDGNILDKKGGFRSIQQLFGLVKDRDDLVWQVFFGGDGSGATFHWHEAAFNILYVGVKEWKIAPPLYRGTTGMTAQHVSAALDPKISLTCVQQPGDMFYIPNHWGHSTLNHGFTIGAAAIVQDYYQNGGASFRGEVEEDGGDEGSPPFLFVHINKTGGTSLISMFTERCEEEYWGDEWYDENGEFHRPFHATAHAYIENYGREAWNKAYTFTVVRHPLARQVSNFFFLTSMGCDKPDNKCEERLIPTLDLDSMSDEEKIDAFHEWLLKLYDAFPPGTPDHYRFGAAGHGNEVYKTFGASQTSWLIDPNGDVVVKDFYKLEELSKDISTLAEKIPCLKNGPLDMAKENKTSKYPNFMLFAKDEQTKKIINEVFADDFKNFGYDPV